MNVYLRTRELFTGCITTYTSTYVVVVMNTAEAYDMLSYLTH